MIHDLLSVCTVVIAVFLLLAGAAFLVCLFMWLTSSIYNRIRSARNTDQAPTPVRPVGPVWKVREEPWPDLPPMPYGLSISGAISDLQRLHAETVGAK